MATKRKHYRAFLEPNNRSVDSYVHVQLGGDWHELKIADCNRSITLSFDSDNYRIGLNKIAKLQKALDMLRIRLEHDALLRGAKKFAEES